MFNPFNTKKEENPIVEAFSDLSTNQKMSLINFLLAVAVCDAPQGDQAKELNFLNTYAKMLKVRSDAAMTYLKTYGNERTTDDLKLLAQSQKDLLIVASWEMVCCDGKPNETETLFTTGLFEKIGVSSDYFADTLKKTIAIIKGNFGV